MKYKVGDKVRIKPLEWFKKITGGEAVLAYLSNFCGKVFTIDEVRTDSYIIAGRPWREEYIEPIIGESNANFLENTAIEMIKQLDGIRHDLFIDKAIIDLYTPQIIHVKNSNEEPLRSLFPKMDDIVNSMKDYLDRTIGLINETSAIPSVSSDTMQEDISIQREIPKFVKPVQKYNKGDILINPLTRAYRIYGYGDDNLSSFRITNTDEKKYYLDYLKGAGLQPIPVRKKK